MVEDSYKATYTPNPQQVKHFFEQSKVLADRFSNEQEWYNAITEAAIHWLD